MSNETTALTAKVEEPSFGSQVSFEHNQRVAKMLSSSSLIPKDYQNNIQNTMIALEMSNRIGASPLMVMQNLYIVHGKPSWSSTFIISAINACGRFSPLRFKINGTNPKDSDYSVTAWANEKETGEVLTGVTVDWEMVKGEGWDAKNGSKWKTMPQLMFMYRSASFFGRLYAPEILMGMHSVDEIEDVSFIDETPTKPHEKEKLLMTPELLTEAIKAIAFEGVDPENIKKEYDCSDEQIKQLDSAVP